MVTRLQCQIRHEWNWHKRVREFSVTCINYSVFIVHLVGILRPFCLLCLCTVQSSVDCHGNRAMVLVCNNFFKYISVLFTIDSISLASISVVCYVTQPSRSWAPSHQSFHSDIDDWSLLCLDGPPRAPISDHKRQLSCLHLPHRHSHFCTPEETSPFNLCFISRNIAKRAGCSIMYVKPLTRLYDLCAQHCEWRY